MNFIKIAGMVSIALCFTVCGYLSGQAYKSRTKELLRARRIIKEVLSRLEFTLDTPERILIEVAKFNTLNCDYLIKAVDSIKKGEHFSESWQNSLAESKLPFNQEDINVIASLSEILGKSDLETQMQALKTLILNIDHITEDAKTEEENGQRLSQTMGVLAGLAAVILLI